MSNSPETVEVLTASAVDKLKSRNLILESTSHGATRWKFTQPLPFSTSFPFIKFRDNIIPSAYNLPTFIVYLGFRHTTARTLFSKYKETGTPDTKLDIMGFVKAHVEFTWLVNKYKGSAINTLDGYSVMGEMGFTEEFVLADIRDFVNEVQRDPSILEYYFHEDQSKTLENMELVDWIQELLYLRILKLESLDQNVHDNLE